MWGAADDGGSGRFAAAFAGVTWAVKSVSALSKTGSGQARRGNILAFGGGRV